MANGDDYLPPSAPPYMRVVQMILKTSGPTALIALGLCLFLTWTVWKQLDAIKTDIVNAHVQMTSWATKQNEIQAAEIDRERRLQALLDDQLHIMRQVCVNTAKSDAELKACVE